jgi:hypothetical protein
MAEKPEPEERATVKILRPGARRATTRFTATREQALIQEQAATQERATNSA